MTFRFTFETAMGAILLTLIFLMGQMAMWVFLFFIPFFYLPRMRRQNMDEREIQLFYKIGNVSTVFMFFSYILIEFLSEGVVNGYKLGDFRLQLCAGMFLLSRGLTGLVILARN
ncbi:MAG: hypothetical protein ACM3Q2_00720 [Syntrophothermus sp.]